MTFNFHGTPYDKLLHAFFGLYVGVALMKSADKKAINKYNIKMNFNSGKPKNGLEALGSCIFGKTANETLVDKYTGIKLQRAGKSFVNGRGTKIANMKDAKPGVLWENILIMQSRFGISNSHIQVIKKAILLWDKLENDEKAEAVNAAYQLVLGADIDRDLELTMYDLNNALLLTTTVDGTYSMSGYAKRFLGKLNIIPNLKEDDETDGIQDSGVQSTSSIANTEQRLVGGKIIKRRVKKFKSIKYKDPRKLKCDDNKECKNEEE